MAEYDIGITCFFLNEEKFLPFSVRSFMESPAVKLIVLVEGCVQSQPRRGVSKQGLSTDGSSEAAELLAKESPKVEHIKAGFVPDKRTLQNRGFEIIRKKLGEAAIYMLAGADEVYHPHELVALQDQFRANPKAKQIVYPFYHFWWRPDLVATGSSWSVPMHRAYRRPGLPMIFAHHAAPPADCGKGPKIHARRGNEYVCRCYHYVGMQDAPHILNKLELYKKRDGHRLKVTDTWSNWKWGQRTQWTHAGGSVMRFEGKHPAVIEPHVWNLTPRDAGGQLLPLPEVPWDGNKASPVLAPPKNIAVFIESAKFPDNPHVARLIAYFQDHHKLTVYTLDGKLEEPGSYQVRKFKAHAINRHDAVILFPESFVWRPLGAKHVAVLWKKLDFKLDFRGYTVYKTLGVEAEYPELPTISKFLHEIERAATVKAVRVSDHALHTSAVPQAQIHRPQPRRHPGSQVPPDTPSQSQSGFYVPAGRAMRETLTVKIVNVTADVWKKGTHFVGGFWTDNKGAVKPDAPRTKVGLTTNTVNPGETLVCKVVLPPSPQDMENGFLEFHVDILDQGAGRWLNVGARIPVQIKQWQVWR